MRAALPPQLPLIADLDSSRAALATAAAAAAATVTGALLDDVREH